jgi:hypothetical protein
MSDMEKQAAVVNNVIAVFSPGMSQQNREDVRNCLHYCTLAADKQFPNEVDGTGWYHLFVAALKQVGWLKLTDSNESSHSSEHGMTLDTVAIKMISGGLTALASPVLSAGLMLPLIGDAVKGLAANSEASSLFNIKSQGKSGSRFAIAACAQNEDGDVQMALGMVSSDEKSNSNQVLFATYSSTSKHLYAANDGLSFNAPVFAQVRADIVAALGHNARDAIRDFPI